MYNLGSPTAFSKVSSSAVEVIGKKFKSSAAAAKSSSAAKVFSKGRISSPSYACSTASLSNGLLETQRFNSILQTDSPSLSNTSKIISKNSILTHSQPSQGHRNPEAMEAMNLDSPLDPQQTNSISQNIMLPCDPLLNQLAVANLIQPADKNKNQSGLGEPCGRAEGNKQLTPADQSLMLPHLLDIYNDCDMALQTPLKNYSSLTPPVLYNYKSLAQELSEAGVP